MLAKYPCAWKVGRTVAAAFLQEKLSASRGGGKSGLHRAKCQVMPGRREPTESATENNRLSLARKAGKGEKVR